MLMFSPERLNGLAWRLCQAGLLVTAVLYGAFLGWQEWRYRQQLVLPMPVEVAPRVAQPLQALDATAVATALGLTAAGALQASAEPLTLQASFVVSSGVSRALLAGAQGARVYQLGESLPGGSVLRRVEANQVLLWNKGREERLMLQPPGGRFLRSLESPAAGSTPGVSTRFLRPIVEPSE